MSAKNIVMAAAGVSNVTPVTYVGGWSETVAATISNVTIFLTSLTGGLSSAPAAGDLVVVYFGAANITTPSLSGIAGYTNLPQLTAIDNTRTGLLVAYKFMPATPDTSFVITGGTGGTSTSGGVVVHVFRGAESVTAVTNTAANTSIPNPPAVTAVAGSIVVAGAASGHTANSGTYTSSDLSQFRSVLNSSVYDLTIGAGIKTGLSGGTVFDPAAFTFSGTDATTHSNASTTLVIAPNDGAGQALFTSSGSFQPPPGVTSISVVCVGGGEGGNSSYGGKGGHLKYVNNISVTPGESLTVTVGAGGGGTTGTTSNAGASGGDSILARGATVLCLARGGGGETIEVGTGGTGGAGGVGYVSNAAAYGGIVSGGGGGGAGGYAGSGGAGAGAASTAGSGGGGGGGGRVNGWADDNNLLVSYGYPGVNGGGVGLLGQGANGAAGTSSPPGISGGGGGSGGSDGSSGSGGLYGGGGGGGAVASDASSTAGATGANGAVRIIWPGDLRQFPSTRTTNQ